VTNVWVEVWRSKHDYENFLDAVPVNDKSAHEIEFITDRFKDFVTDDHPEVYVDDGVATIPDAEVGQRKFDAVAFREYRLGLHDPQDHETCRRRLHRASLVHARVWYRHLHPTRAAARFSCPQPR
jgi:hypothetical protein